MITRRIVFPSPLQAKLVEQEISHELRPRQVLVRTRVTAISPGTELIIYTGKHSALADPNAAWPKFPFNPGYSAVGEIMAVGDGVTELAVGDRVFTRQGHVSEAVVDASTVVRVPPSIPDQDAAFAALIAISLNGVRLARIELGETVVVAGLGLIGLFAAQLAAIAGVETVIGADLLAERREAARSLGLDMLEVVDPTPVGIEALVRSLTQGRGADVVIDATGSPKAVPDLLRLPRTMGRYVLLGCPHGQVEMDLYSQINRECLTIIGAHERAAGRSDGPCHRWNNRDNIAFVLRLIAQGRLRVDPLISIVTSPLESAEVYARLASPGSSLLGVVFDWLTM